MNDGSTRHAESQVPHERILIVEADDATAKGLKFNFEEEGYDVSVVDDPSLALAEFETADTEFGLVVVDLDDSVSSGCESCHQIRQRDHDVSILVLSPNTSGDDEVRALRSGADCFMTKPFELKQLLSWVRLHLPYHTQA